MSNVVNLNKARKAKARVEAQDQAKANRAKFGRTKAQAAVVKSEIEKTERALDGAKRETD